MSHSAPIPLQHYRGSQFQVGQVWLYKNRPADSNSVLQIVAVDLLHEREVAVHIQVRGLNMQRLPTKPDEGTASHLPFSEEALRDSITHLLSQSSPLPDDFEEGYEMWREAFLSGKAGVFSVSVADVIGFIDDTVPNKN